jgi:hypothetical protein
VIERDKKSKHREHVKNEEQRRENQIDSYERHENNQQANASLTITTICIWHYQAVGVFNSIETTENNIRIRRIEESKGGNTLTMTSSNGQTYS